MSKAKKIKSLLENPSVLSAEQKQKKDNENEKFCVRIRFFSLLISNKIKSDANERKNINKTDDEKTELYGNYQRKKETKKNN